MSVTVAFDVQRLDTVHTVTDPIPTTGTPVEIGIEMVRHRSIPTLDSDVIAVRVGVVRSLYGDSLNGRTLRSLFGPPHSGRWVISYKCRTIDHSLAPSSFQIPREVQ
jgi:hypothetical protein